jgi:hypothetical protein
MLASGMSHIAAAAVIGCTRQTIDHFVKHDAARGQVVVA